VTNFKSFLVTEAEMKNVRRRARFQQPADVCSHQVFFLIFFFFFFFFFFFL